MKLPFLIGIGGGVALVVAIVGGLLIAPDITKAEKKEPLARYWTTARLERELSPRATTWQAGTNLIVPQGVTCRQFNSHALSRVVLVCS